MDERLRGWMSGWVVGLQQHQLQSAAEASAVLLKLPPAPPAPCHDSPLADVAGGGRGLAEAAPLNLALEAFAVLLLVALGLATVADVRGRIARLAALQLEEGGMRR